MNKEIKTKPKNFLDLPVQENVNFSERASHVLEFSEDVPETYPSKYKEGDVVYKWRVLEEGTPKTLWVSAWNLAGQLRRLLAEGKLKDSKYRITRIGEGFNIRYEIEGVA